MSNPKQDNNFKWLMIGFAAMSFALMAPAMFSAFGPDERAERIAACMTQPGMQYVDGDCIPQDE